ncbi:Protein C12.2 [Daphnia magna]|uniref:von Willebrand factor A domain-containing protein 8 n=1 Tax=Daphnia magna TaxID=35525 RepID=A0A164KSD1_9CRUS|nr:Protein C12.2 [Daphnia magna]
MYIKGLSSVCSYLPKYNSFKTCSSIRSNVCYREKISKRYISLTTQSLRNEETLEIGGVTRKLTKSERVELVPTRYDHLELDQSTLKKLRWMLQKDVLGQDMFLIGPPGPEKFRIAHLYAQLVNQEVEYIALSRDTTESDLKQRREIHSGSAHFEDQAAVRAAIHGRILILDGIEKTERNVLPVLNNLLENREMPLEDGRLLISSARYDKLRKASKSTDLENWKLVRVDEKFRVIALGIPVPKYRGHPLDPPLRSRFQALKIEQKSFKDQLLTLRQVAPGVPESSMIELASFAYAINASESEAQGLPDFPISSLPLAVALMENNPDLSVDNVLHRLYPYKSFLTKDGQSMIENLMKTFKIDNTTQHQLSIENNPTPSVQRGAQVRDYIATKYHQQVVHELKKSIEIHDICLIGARGSGKSTLIRQLANLLSLEVEPIMLYQDMTSRDLLQQRSTLPNGDTVWTPSALLKAAIDGKLAVIDGLHRINTGTLFTLQSIIHEREAQLFDGSRILRHDRYDALQERLGCSKEIMAEKKLFKVHKNFRIIALAEPPNSTGKTSSHWLSPEVLSMFFFHTLRPMNMEEEVNILEALVGDKLALAMHPVLKLAQHVRQSNDPTLNSLAPSLSTRQLLRLAKRLKEYPNSDPWGLVERTCLSQFLPRLPQEALRRAMESCGIEKTAPFETSDSQLCCVVKNGVLTIGETKAKIYQQGNLAKIPDVVFHDTRQHLRVLEALLQDFILGDHLLLVGNQGVGKNRLIDRLLALMNRPREYIQLHRDTTVQSLTVQPTVLNGVVEFQDSPLVRAARDGSVLIVDEADKAPTQVTCILKTLIENGEMLLSDGRRILPMGVRSDIKETDIVRLHPDFRMIVLANRPGFPFLGNDFFAALGDVFSVHAIENPSLESELELLRHFGPSLSDKTLRSVVQAFSQLRSLADQGMLNYPYSTREVINVVKHLERYPKDGIVRTVSNVFDFDAYSPEAKELIIRVFHENGIPLGASVNNVFYEPQGTHVQLFNPNEADSTAYQMDFNIQSVFAVMNDKVIIQSQNSNQKFLFDVKNGLLQVIEESQTLGPVTSNIVSHSDSKALFTMKNYYGTHMTIPQNELLLWPGCACSDSTNIVLLPTNDSVVRIASGEEVPKPIDRKKNLYFLQVADLSGQTLRYIPIPNSEQRRRYGNSDKKTHLCAYNQGSVVTVDDSGFIRLWEINQSQITKSLEVWRSNVGDDVGQLTIKRTQQSGDVSGPKVGKIDPKNTPHVGGNTWAGGTGGRDTAGLGGRGGPYRLDAGHDVHQVSDEDKAAVPEEIQRAAREMGKKAYQERLKQIRMDPVDAELYQKFSSSIQKQVLALKVILDNIQAKGKERQWMRHQTYGDLDDTKIIEGLTGEKNIYRRRAELHPELGAPPEKPKHLRLLVDVSGSMYRFNSYDRRLEREMAAVLLFMEALDGHSEKWRYDIVGHSGETLNLQLVSADRPPKDDKQRFDVLLNMHAHSQFCMAGDHTLEASKQSVASLSEATDIDEAFVILLSDANLDRYGIPAVQSCRSAYKYVFVATRGKDSFGRHATTSFVGIDSTCSMHVK